MFPSVGLTPDPVVMVHRHVLRMFPDRDSDMVHLHFLPDGYNPAKSGVAVVIEGDTSQVDGVTHSRDLVKVNVFGPDHQQVRVLGRRLYTALTQGLSGIGLGVDRSRSQFFGSGPSYTPTGFVSTMSISVGAGRIFTVPGK